MNAVWKDTDIVIDRNNNLNYRIESDGIVYFEGVAVPKPNNNQITIRLNDYAKSIVNSNVEIPFNTNDYVVMPDYCKEISIIDNSTNAVLSSVRFHNSYDYNDIVIEDDEGADVDFTTTISKISNPILNTYATGGNILYTLHQGINYDGISGFSRLTIKNDDETILSDFVNFTNGSTITICFKAEQSGTYYIELSGTETTYTINVEDKCVKYNLHYQNAAGGFDTLPIDGKRDKRTDDLTFEYYKSKGNNQNINKPQMNKFKVDITPRWELQTGWLNDEQSKKMYNLFTSQKVWLEDINEGTITPVYITNNSVDYKTFTNNSRKKYNYTISVTSANTLIKL